MTLAEAAVEYATLSAQYTTNLTTLGTACEDIVDPAKQLLAFAAADKKEFGDPTSATEGYGDVAIISPSDACRNALNAMSSTIGDFNDLLTRYEGLSPDAGTTTAINAAKT